jgi:hypothetical protein
MQVLQPCFHLKRLRVQPLQLEQVRLERLPLGDRRLEHPSSRRLLETELPRRLQRLALPLLLSPILLHHVQPQGQRLENLRL